MIIKSMSRKEASFGQLLDYVSRDAADRRFAVRHNVLAQDVTGLTAEFEANGELLQKRKNGVVMYHEIISITRAKSLSEDAQKEALRGIALDYIKQRCPGSLVYGTLHDDRSDQLHYHLVISANSFGATNRHRLPKAEFRQIQVGIEQRTLALHPELEQSLAIGKRAKPRQLSQPGIELQRRTGSTPKKQSLKLTTAALFQAAQDPQHLFKVLTDNGLELYRRGKSIGLRDLKSGRTHRLATLGVDEAFKTMNQRFAMTPKEMTQAVRVTHLQNGMTADGNKPSHNKSQDLPQTRALIAELLPNTVGQIATEATVMVELAVHQAGGPKPHIPAAKREPDTERISREHREDIAKLRAEQAAQSHQSSDSNRQKR